MKKTLLVSLVAVSSLVSLSWAETCKNDGKTVFCQFSSGCYEQSTEYSDGASCKHPDCTCAQLAAHCANVGSEYTGVTGLGESNNWGEGVNCKTNGGTWTGNGQNPDDVGARGYCNWGVCDCDPNDGYSCLEGGCFEIKDDKQLSDCNDILSSRSQCPPASLPKEDGGTCSGSSPIRPAQQLETSLFLSIVPQDGSLLISSLKEATVSLFDMSGKQVFSQNVPAGYNGTISLSGQKLGVYYAVVSSGSSKQTVKVVLK